MQLVAAAKMKKAQDQATHGRAYAESMNKILVALRDAAEEGSHPYFVEGKGDKTLVLVIASDKGLCGALNTNLFKKLINANLEGECNYITIGRKASQALSRLRKNLVADFRSRTQPSLLICARLVIISRSSSARVITRGCWSSSTTSSTPSLWCRPSSSCCQSTR